MGYLWDRYGFVRRSNYLYALRYIKTLEGSRKGQGGDYSQIGAVKEAIDMQKLVNTLDSLRASAVGKGAKKA